MRLEGWYWGQNVIELLSIPRPLGIAKKEDQQRNKHSSLGKEYWQKDPDPSQHSSNIHNPFC